MPASYRQATSTLMQRMHMIHGVHPLQNWRPGTGGRVSGSSEVYWALCRSCRARLDLHNNRRRKRGESGSETYRSSARLERRLGEQLHQRISTRSRSRRSARKPRSDSSDVSSRGPAY